MIIFIFHFNFIYNFGACAESNLEYCPQRLHCQEKTTQKNPEIFEINYIFRHLLRAKFRRTLKALFSECYEKQADV